MALEKFHKYSGEVDPNEVPAFGCDQSAPKTRELMLSLRRLDGSAEAFQYMYLYNVRKNPEATEVVLTYSGHIVTVEGANLLDLYNKLLGCGIQFIQEMKADDQREDKPFIKMITVTDLCSKFREKTA